MKILGFRLMDRLGYRFRFGIVCVCGFRLCNLYRLFRLRLLGLWRLNLKQLALVAQQQYYFTHTLNECINLEACQIFENEIVFILEFVENAIRL